MDPVPVPVSLGHRMQRLIRKLGGCGDGGVFGEEAEADQNNKTSMAGSSPGRRPRHGSFPKLLFESIVSAETII